MHWDLIPVSHPEQISQAQQIDRKRITLQLAEIQQIITAQSHSRVGPQEAGLQPQSLKVSSGDLLDWSSEKLHMTMF